MPKSHAPYPPEFRAEAMRLIRTSGKSLAQLGRELQVTTETLREWIKQADIDDGVRHDGLTTEETEEVRRLRREVKTLREGREILLKAAAFFAKETGQEPEVRYLFVEREKVNHTIVMLRRVLRVSCSGFYAWRKREPSARAREDAVLTERIRSIHEQSRRTYGAPRVHAELAAGGARCGRKRVARLMRAAGVVGCHRRRHVVTTVREPSAPLAPDRMERQFVADEPNTRWTADITSVPSWSGFLYLADVPGALWALCSRRIVGWAMVGALWALSRPSS